MNIFNIERAYRTMKERGWEKLYIFVDVHETIAKGYYSEKNPLTFYPNALKVLQQWSNKPETDWSLIEKELKRIGQW